MAAGDAATPLLVLETTYQYHEGCPACAVERSKAVNPGIPYMRFFHIWIIILVSCTYAPPIDHCFIYTPTCSCMLRFLLDCLSNLLIIHVIFEKANGRALAFTHPHAISLL
jgi:hypothetical protein